MPKSEDELASTCDLIDAITDRCEEGVTTICVPVAMLRYRNCLVRRVLAKLARMGEANGMEASKIREAR